MTLGTKLRNSDCDLGTLMCVLTNINNISTAVIVGVSTGNVKITESRLSFFLFSFSFLFSF